MTHNSLAASLALCLHISRRNWAVYKKDFLANISPSVADPAFIMISLGLGLGGFVANISGRSYMEYLAPGLTVATTLFTSFFETSYGFYVRLVYENVYKAMLTTPIGPHHVVFGEFLWVGFKGAAMAICVAFVTALFGLMQDPLLLPLIAIMGFLVGIACGAIGLIGSGVIRNINQFQTVYSFVISPLFYLSGVFFPFEQLPAPLRWLANLFPLAHGVRMAHAIFWNENVVSVMLWGSLFLGLQSVVFGSVAFVLIRKKLIT
jgi:lipooligosaccharide transport system permease protein